MTLDEWMRKNPPGKKRTESYFNAYREEIRALLEKKYSMRDILRFLQEEKGCTLDLTTLRAWMIRNDLPFNRKPKGLPAFSQYKEEILALYEQGKTHGEILRYLQEEKKVIASRPSLSQWLWRNGLRKGNTRNPKRSFSKESALKRETGEER